MSPHYMKKCPPGVLCIENITLFILIAITGIIGYLAYCHHTRNVPDKNTTTTTTNITIPQQTNQFREDILLNPYTPPYRNDGYGMIRNQMVATNVGAVDVSYRQIGILTPTQKSSITDTQTNQILPLMGRPLFTNRDKWQFYTMTKHNIKLPITNKGKSGSNEYGCDNIYNGDIIYVEGYAMGFKATVYENDTMRYLPV
jgi:hypothetical protein